MIYIYIYIYLACKRVKTIFYIKRQNIVAM